MEYNHSELPLTMQALSRLEGVLGELDGKVEHFAEGRRALREDLQQVRLQNESLQEATQVVTARLNAAINRLQTLLEE